MVYPNRQKMAVRYLSHAWKKIMQAGLLTSTAYVLSWCSLIGKPCTIIWPPSRVVCMMQLVLYYLVYTVAFVKLLCFKTSSQNGCLWRLCRSLPYIIVSYLEILFERKAVVDIERIYALSEKLDILHPCFVKVVPAFAQLIQVWYIVTVLGKVM